MPELENVAYAIGPAPEYAIAPASEGYVYTWISGTPEIVCLRCGALVHPAVKVHDDFHNDLDKVLNKHGKVTFTNNPDI